MYLGAPRRSAPVSPGSFPPSLRRDPARHRMSTSLRIEELKKKFDENPRRYFAPLANEYRKAGDLQQAIAICQAHLPQQPGHMSGHIVYGQALFEAKQFDQARTVFETALALDPENLIALRYLGRSEEHTSELQSRQYLVCRLLLEKKKNSSYT